MLQWPPFQDSTDDCSDVAPTYIDSLRARVELQGPPSDAVPEHYVWLSSPWCGGSLVEHVPSSTVVPYDPRKLTIVSDCHLAVP